jgi:hypothetical protein
LFLLGIVDLDLIGHLELDSELASGIVGKEDLDLDSHDTLLEEDVTIGEIDEIEFGLTRGDDVAYE